MAKIQITLDNPEQTTITVNAVEINGKLVVNLHSTTYNLLVAESDQETGKQVNTSVAVRNSGYQVKVEYQRRQLNESPLPMRAFEMKDGSVSSELPLPQENVVYLVSPGTREFLTNTGIGREDIWSPYSIQDYRIDQRAIKCATALAH